MIERTADVEYIRSVATHPRAWRWISEDGDRPEDYEPDMHRTVYVRVPDGYLSFRPFTRAVWEAHIVLRPKPKDPETQALLALAYMVDQGVPRFLAKIVSQNRHAIAFAKKIGFEECGRVANACYRQGRPFDVVLMEF